MAIILRPIKCGAQVPDGSRCNEFTTVTNTQYMYDRQPTIGGGSDYNLKEIHYMAVCPSCGELELVEKQ
jgi:hypothetical protein